MALDVNDNAVDGLRVDAIVMANVVAAAILRFILLRSKIIALYFSARIHV
jgi:hypothetical protein